MHILYVNTDAVMVCVIGLYDACKKGDLGQVKELLKLVHNGLNSTVCEGRSLLMW